MDIFRFALLALFISTFGAKLTLASDAHPLLAAGPMVGAVDMREARLWAQTQREARLKAFWWPWDAPGQRAESAEIETSAEDAFAATIVLGGLKPGVTYEYELFIDGEKVRAPYATQFTTAPFFQGRTPPPDFEVLLASGHYVVEDGFEPLNRTNGAGYTIFSKMLERKPSFVIWTGNNVFLRESDWFSQSGFLARYSHNRAHPDLQPLIGSVPQMAVWSEADYGPAQAGALLWNKSQSLHAFRAFWPNLTHGVAGIEGITTRARWSDVDFFFLDDRWYRDLSSGLEAKREVFGEAQLNWLVQSLKSSNATFKVIVSGTAIVNPAESNSNATAAPRERQTLISELVRARIDGLFFVNGGKGFAEMTKMVQAGAPDFFELSVGPVTMRPATDAQELNYFRAPGSSVFERHFASLRFHGREDDRQLTVSIFGTNGRELWSQTIKEVQMAF